MISQEDLELLKIVDYAAKIQPTLKEITTTKKL